MSKFDIVYGRKINKRENIEKNIKGNDPFNCEACVYSTYALHKEEHGNTSVDQCIIVCERSTHIYQDRKQRKRKRTGQEKLTREKERNAP